jgi:hypothetical protein
MNANEGDLSPFRNAAAWAGVGSLILLQIVLQFLIGYGLKAFGADRVECHVGILPMGKVSFACHRTQPFVVRHVSPHSKKFQPPIGAASFGKCRRRNRSYVIVGARPIPSLVKIAQVREFVYSINGDACPFAVFGRRKRLSNMSLFCIGMVEAAGVGRFNAKSASRPRQRVSRT